MNAPLLLLSLVITVAVSCNRSEQTNHAGVGSREQHEEAIGSFQGGQRRFRTLIATVRDEKSFDIAKPGLETVISDWRQVALTLRDLDPPSENDQARIREMIIQGHRRTEPTGEDMLSLISIEGREKEVTKWLEDFAEAGREAGAEMSRLYGPRDYGVAKVPKLDLGGVAVDAQD